ncbi:MAG: hypothetical protein LBJ14_07410 [Desulfarculales bacterium]|jgi:hypothetical protein|nr:hypothetical protein [Desulfarculales bacterium]
MAIKLNDWNYLSTADKDAVIAFLTRNCKIDLESPAGQVTNQSGVYPIADGTTSGGNPMKYGDEYRIYINSLNNCPPFLQGECKTAPSPYEARIGGNEAIVAIMRYGNFRVGNN